MEYGLLGERLEHSFSPLIHRVMGDYDYRLLPVPPAQMRRILQERRFKGLNVTIPYKRDALALCDEASEEARSVGCANTVINRRGRLIACNTDLPGFLYMLRRSGLSPKGKKTAILGSGGAALAARAACRLEGAREIIDVSRRGPVDYEALRRRHADIELIVNCTPVGMYPDTMASPVSLADFPRLSGVADVIYNPAKTALILDAEERGIPHADGLYMLAAQAYYAAQLFLDRALPEEKIAQAYRAVRRETLNLVLVGMPGSGKTTLGRRAAALLGRKFVDLDEEIERVHGPVPAIFARLGEAAFREIESETAARFGRESGLVIAAGGGAALRKENVRAFRQNGIVAWVRRPVEKLSTEGRPLSTDPDALRAMEEKRLPCYRRCADFAVDNDGEIDAAAQTLKEGFDEAAGSERA